MEAARVERLVERLRRPRRRWLGTTVCIYALVLFHMLRESAILSSVGGGLGDDGLPACGPLVVCRHDVVRSGAALPLWRPNSSCVEHACALRVIHPLRASLGDRVGVYLMLATLGKLRCEVSPPLPLASPYSVLICTTFPPSPSATRRSSPAGRCLLRASRGRLATSAAAVSLRGSNPLSAEPSQRTPLQPSHPRRP